MNAEAQAPDLEPPSYTHTLNGHTFKKGSTLANIQKIERERIEKERLELERLENERLSALKAQEEALKLERDRLEIEAKKLQDKKAKKANLLTKTNPTVNNSGGCWDIARNLTINAFGESEVESMLTLIKRESNCNPNALNKSSGACGIPQSLPCSKLPQGINTSTEGQIIWMLNYVKARYGTPSKALAHSYSKNWY